MTDFVFNRSSFDLPRIGLIVQLLSIEIKDLALIVKLDDDFPWHNIGEVKSAEYLNTAAREDGNRTVD